jgi:hypothetical protein
MVRPCQRLLRRLTHRPLAAFCCEKSKQIKASFFAGPWQLKTQDVSASAQARWLRTARVLTFSLPTHPTRPIMGERCAMCIAVAGSGRQQCKWRLVVPWKNGPPWGCFLRHFVHDRLSPLAASISLRCSQSRN